MLLFLAGALTGAAVMFLVVMVVGMRLEQYVRAYGQAGGPPWERTR